jgi:hypothetical protein
MADFAIWVSACERALGLETGEALEAYRANCAEARNLALEASPLYEPLTLLATEGFNGTTSELLIRLSAISGEGTRRSGRWPTAGIEIDFSRPEHGGRRFISVHRARSTSEISSPPSPSSPDPATDAHIRIGEHSDSVR